MRPFAIAALFSLLMIYGCGGRYQSENVASNSGFASFAVLPATTDDGAYAIGVSGDGRTAVGVQTSQREPLYWVGTQGPVVLASPIGDPDDLTGASDDGSVLIGSVSTSTGTQGFTFRPFGPVYTLILNPAGYVGANGVDLNADGSVVLGLALASTGNNRAFVQHGSTQILLPERTPDTRAVATSLSSDGAYAVGSSDGFPVRWSTSDVPTLLALSDAPGIADDASADGSIVVGRTTVGGTAQAFRWTAEEGAVSIGARVPSDESFGALSVSGDGRTIVGNALLTAGNQRPFVWTLSGGFRYLGDLFGADAAFGGLLNPYVRDVSRDGKALIGGGQDPLVSGGRGFRVWRMTLR